MEGGGDATVRPDQQDGASLAQLGELCVQRRFAARGELVVFQRRHVFQRGLDVGDGIRLQPARPAGIVQLFRVGQQIAVVEQPADGRRPIKRVAAHPAFGSAGFQRHHDVIGIFGRGAQPGVFEIVDAGFQANADFFGQMAVAHDFQAQFVRFFNNGAGGGFAHFVLIDQLDDVDTGRLQLAHLGARIFRVVHAPAEGFGAGIGVLL